MENKVICQFCGEEMKPGVSHIGAGLNNKSFWCECGSTCNFLKNFSKKIQSTKVQVEYE